MISTNIPSQPESLTTSIYTHTPTQAESTETNFSTLSSIIDAKISERNKFVVRKIQFQGATADVIELDTFEGRVDIFEVAEALVSSPETDFVGYKKATLSSEIVTSIKLHYGVVPNILLFSVGNESFLSIDGEFLTLKRK